jgi:hypothetical protein
MTQTDITPKIKETIVLKKFDGDGPEDRTDEPLEVLVIEDGKIISHTKRSQE